jgi:hypothetical protein
VRRRYKALVKRVRALESGIFAIDSARTRSGSMLEEALSRIAASRTAAAKKPFTMQRLWHQAAWGGIAVLTLLLAVLAGLSDVGSQRLSTAFGWSSGASPRLPLRMAAGPQGSTQQTASPPSQNQQSAASRSLDTEALMLRQLAQSMRSLAEDRDRMMTRLAALEHTMDDMTSSISQQIEAAKTANVQPTPPWITAASIASIDAPTAPPAGWASPPQSSPPAGAPAAPPRDLGATATEAPAYGVEIGGASSIKGLHARWAGVRATFGSILDGLRPVVAVRDNPKTRRNEYRLVIGPFANAGAAEQLCATLTVAQLPCQPTMFDGRSLALE